MNKDPYVYEGTNVLINKLNIQDPDKLDKAESDFASLAISHLRNSDFEVNSIYDFLGIHRRLSSALYGWAGKPRIIDIYKSEPLLGGKPIDYVFASYIDTALEELQKEFEAIDWDAFDPSAKIGKACHFASELWHIHPFREGNARASAMALYFLVKKAGLHANIDFLSRNGKFFRNALVLSCCLYSASKTEYPLGIVSDSVTLKNKNSGKYESIEGTEVKKYSYNHHTTDRLETIKKPADWKR